MSQKPRGKFVRYHVHSVHSTRDGMLPVKTIVKEAADAGEIPSLTDHGSIGGALDFISACEEFKTKGVFGCEFYINKNIKRLQELRKLIDKEKDPDVKKQLQRERDSKRKNNHIVLIAKNTHGFYNILALNNKAYLFGFYNKPTIDYDDLFSMTPDEDGDYGVIITTACLAGPPARYILEKDISAAIEWCKMMKEKFGKDFYLEVQINGLADQKKINKAYIKLSEKLKIPMCVGIDAHYLNKDWAETHQDLLLLQNKNTRDDIGKYDYRITWENGKGEVKTKKVAEGKDFRKGFKIEDIEAGMEFGKGKSKDVVLEVKKVARAWEFATDENWYMSEEEVRKTIKRNHKELVDHVDEIIKNNYKIGNNIKPIELDRKIKLPFIENAYEIMVTKVKDALRDYAKDRKLDHPVSEYVERLKYELKIIKENKFEDYFLILADVMDFARKNDIALGVARGSAGGCLVAYLLGIHRMDPLEKRWDGIMFERFLNPDRLKYPDIDVDVDGDRRDEIINYLIDKYGSRYVAYVGIRSEYSAKSAIRDLGTVHMVPSKESIMCTKTYNPAQTVDENIKTKPESAKYFKNYPDLKKAVGRLDGIISSLGIHAGGVVISHEDYPMDKFCALQRPGDDGRVATLWDKNELEKIGLIKYDILGVSSAAQVHKTMRMIGHDPYVDPPEEEEVFQDVILANKNKNIFQFETTLGYRAFDDFKPMSIMELAAASAVLRVLGTNEGRDLYDVYRDNVTEYQMGNFDYWKERLRDEILSDKNYKIAEKVLRQSYGVLIFQEQLAELAHKLSDGKLSFGQGDVFRRKLEDYGKKHGKLNDHHGDIKGQKKWHKGFMDILNEYIIPYLGEDIKYPGVQDFINAKVNNEGNIVTPRKGIISWLLSSASYLFNKSHAIAYSINTYNMMWLKHHYTLEFWTASLQLEEDNLDKIRNYVTAIKAETDIKVLPPSINESDLSFSMNKKSNEIRYGLRAVKGLGKSAQAIIHERNENGMFKSAKDFVTRLKGTPANNKKVIQNLLSVGAFDDFGDVEDVYNDFVDEGKDLNPIEVNVVDRAIVEAKLLGVNISFIHPIAERAGMYMPIPDVEDGTQEVVAVKVMKIMDKVTKNNKPYKMLKVECLNSGSIVNLFDWQNRKDIDTDYLIARVKRQNNFYTLLGPSSLSPISNRAKNLAKRVLVNE